MLFFNILHLYFVFFFNVLFLIFMTFFLIFTAVQVDIYSEYQEDNGSSSSPTLEVGVFLMKEDKKL